MLLDRLRDRGVQAIFGEEPQQSRSLEQIASELRVPLVPIYGGSLSAGERPSRQLYRVHARKRSPHHGSLIWERRLSMVESRFIDRFAHGGLWQRAKHRGRFEYHHTGWQPQLPAGGQRRGQKHLVKSDCRFDTVSPW